MNNILGKIKIAFIVLFAVSGMEGFAQKSYNMQGFEMILEPLMQQMFSAKKDNERFAANEKFISEMEQALDFDKSFAYKFPKLDKINILTSKDKQFKIFTWAIADDNGTYENYGFIQSKNKVTGEYRTFRLFDKSEQIMDEENQKLDDSSWYGCVYYDLVEQSFDKRTYYVLLGWDGNDLYSRKKIIEPISFKSDGSPVFGQNVFYKDKDRMRYVFEYSTDANFTLKYGLQYYDIVSNQKAKGSKFHKPKPFEKEPAKTEKDKMIFFDLLEPATMGMDDLKLYYVPSGEVVGLKFEGGKWKKIKHNILPRNKSEKNDDYEPNYNIQRSLFPKKTKK